MAPQVFRVNQTNTNPPLCQSGITAKRSKLTQLWKEIENKKRTREKKSDSRHFAAAATSIAFLGMKTLDLDKACEIQSCRELNYLSNKTNFIKFWLRMKKLWLKYDCWFSENLLLNYDEFHSLQTLFSSPLFKDIKRVFIAEIWSFPFLPGLGFLGE